MCYGVSQKVLCDLFVLLSPPILLLSGAVVALGAVAVALCHVRGGAVKVGDGRTCRWDLPVKYCSVRLMVAEDVIARSLLLLRRILLSTASVVGVVAVVSLLSVSSQNSTSF